MSTAIRRVGMEETTNGAKVNREKRKTKVGRRGMKPGRSEGGTEDGDRACFISSRPVLVGSEFGQGRDAGGKSFEREVVDTACLPSNGCWFPCPSCLSLDGRRRWHFIRNLVALPPHHQQISISNRFDGTNYFPSLPPPVWDPSDAVFSVLS